ncbi:MAG: MBL fold metallo-hydrolase [Solirubrobacteraceae bacterium]|nr:MBL fold metallo-hydrolase [Solirubrobacteraceae bacterium]
MTTEAHRAREGVNGWWAVDALAPGVWRIAEPGHVASFLVEGDRRAALIDTGMGIHPIRPVVSSLTDRPVVVVNTHHHFDHVGGNAEFDEIVIHAAGADRLAAGASLDLVPRYLPYAEAAAAAFTAYEAADRTWFHQLTDDRRVRPLPPGLAASWNIRPTRATGTVVDGDEIDLGGRALRVIEGPGHSSDGIVLELAGERILFGGDTVNTGPTYACTPDSDVAVLAGSLERLASMADRFDLVACCHWLVTVVGPEMLRSQAKGIRDVAEGRADLTPAVDCLGVAVREARFDGYSVLVPA